MSEHDYLIAKSKNVIAQLRRTSDPTNRLGRLAAGREAAQQLRTPGLRENARNTIAEAKRSKLRAMLDEAGMESRLRSQHLVASRPRFGTPYTTGSHTQPWVEETANRPRRGNTKFTYTAARPRRGDTEFTYTASGKGQSRGDRSRLGSGVLP